MNELDLFAAAIAITDQGERKSLLDRECAGRPDVRQRIEQLLEAHFHSHPLIDRPVLEQTVAYVSLEQPGSVIAGRYKLLEQIGEGGMGQVWVAEQTQPVRRKVALKLIKAGMDSKSVIARFEAERQALALMDHPNVAKVLDGGLTDAGRPFFVMEYVKGVPITEYCDATRLSLTERLQLFAQVCQAVQHAHQKGIIHRDLKPSNILVAPYDDRPVPKIIDFGLAKAMHQSLTEKTLHTAHETVLGTPLYMSPEQVHLNNLDVDTRSDIYSLGVLLYELLTGTTPLEKQRFKQAAWDEIRRIIREEEPPRPSTRLSSTNTLPSLAACRQSEPLKLTKQVRGDLDWIVMKALEKDRSRRYDTANGFAADVMRYLAGEAVQAHPPSAAYRLRKFARKNRAILTTATAFALLLLTSAAISGWLAIKARRAEAIAEANLKDAVDASKEASEKTALLTKETMLHMSARLEAEQAAESSNLDLNLAELNSDPRLGLLRLAKPYQRHMDNIRLEARTVDGSDIGFHPSRMYTPKMEALEEFRTVAVLAVGQQFAPLLPPLTHEGVDPIDLQIAASGQRLLTLGKDGTARLWDTRTAQPVAVLRKTQEQVLRCRFSPDGKTAFTDAPDGVVRLWDTTDGRYRAETAPRPSHVCAESKSDYAGHGGRSYRTADITHLSDNRLVTRSIGSGFPERLELTGPVELWDSQTGRLIAQLEDQGSSSLVNYQFSGDGKWITAWEGEATVAVYDATDGKLRTKLKHAPEHQLRGRLFFAPDSDRLATVGQINDDVSQFHIYLWNTRTWQLISVTGPCQGTVFPPAKGFMNFNGEVFAFNGDNIDNGFQPMNRLSVFRFGNNTKLNDDAPQNIATVSRQGDRVLMDNGFIMDTRTWQRVPVPAGNKYASDLIQFAADKRFAFVDDSHTTFQGINRIIDAKTEKIIPTRASWLHSPGIGWVGLYSSAKYELQRLPLPDQMAIPPDIVELWAQVAVRGQLSANGEFVKCDERTWEAKRQELAAIPPPIADFPFPGHLASDKLHWLRAEFHDAKTDVDKLRWASELIRRAEANRDQIEADRWRAEQKRLSTVSGEMK